MGTPLMLVLCSHCNRYEPLTGNIVNVLVDKNCRDKDNPHLLSEVDLVCWDCTNFTATRKWYTDESEIREAEIALFVDTDEEDKEE